MQRRCISQRAGSCSRQDEWSRKVLSRGDHLSRTRWKGVRERGKRLIFETVKFTVSRGTTFQGESAAKVLSSLPSTPPQQQGGLWGQETVDKAGSGSRYSQGTSALDEKTGSRALTREEG